ncbi:hypothetical protein BD769DRAFT_1389889 [Suillus cothurnatus]|nr:hypothetical protein BD769DRAFT_1389889 [Suillus cothurnatus]
MPHKLQSSRLPSYCSWVPIANISESVVDSKQHGLRSLASNFYGPWRLSGTTVMLMSSSKRRFICSPLPVHVKSDPRENLPSTRDSTCLFTLKRRREESPTRPGKASNLNSALGGEPGLREIREAVRPWKGLIPAAPTQAREMLASNVPTEILFVNNALQMITAEKDTVMKGRQLEELTVGENRGFRGDTLRMTPYETGSRLRV